MQKRQNRNSLVLAVFCLLLIAGFIQSAWAIPAQADTTAMPSFFQAPQPMGQDGFAGALFRTILSLLLVLAMIYLGVWALRKYANSRQIRGSLPLQILGSTYLDSKKRISVARVAGRYLLIGVTEQSINLITELSVEEGEALFQKQSSSSSHEPVFQQLFKHFRQKQENNEAS